MIDALAGVDYEIHEHQWDAMANRLRMKIVEDYESRRYSSWRSWFRIYTPALAGAAALLLVTFGIYRLTPRTVPAPPSTISLAQPAVVVNPSLDPVTVEFLEQSELLLRSVMKLQ